MTDRAEAADAVIVGGGFYGVCLALYLRSALDKVVLLEAETTLLARASFVNQARIHTGFHYPRSFVTAQRSLALYRRFCSDFREAVVDDFSMLYAIPRRGSKVSPQRFQRMFEELDAPITRANQSETALFNPAAIASVFRCEEYAFNAVKLRDLLCDRLEAAGVDVRTGVRVEKVKPDAAVTEVCLENGARLRAPIVVNATYGNPDLASTDPAFAARLKYELAEVALVKPPAELDRVGITVMDGPFFSLMPFPARDCHSLTHVRFTPHAAWLVGQCVADPASERMRPHWLHMMRDAERYVPAIRSAEWRESLFEVKAVPLRNESDDGRPILFSRHPEAPGTLSILGGKLDNIYDLFQAIDTFGPPFGFQGRSLTTELLVGEGK